MPKKENRDVKKGTLSRRDFLKNAGFVAGGIGTAAFLSACSPVTSTVTSTVKTTVTQTGAGSTPTGNLITVLNPEIANKTVERSPLIPRLDTVDGKTIWFVSENWGDVTSTKIFFEELQKWFAANHPTTTLVYKIKQGSFMTDDPALWKQIETSADAAILGLAG